MRLIAFLAALFCASAALAQQSTVSFNVVALTVGTTSATVSSGHDRRHLEFQNQSPTATIYCTMDGTAAVATPTAKQLTFPPLGGYVWASAIIPSNAFNCIATASGTPLTLIE